MKQYKDLVTSFVRQWNFTRSETEEILESLNEKCLKFRPKGKQWKRMVDQFLCIARAQSVYTRAIETGWIDFSLFSNPDFLKRFEIEKREDLIKLLKQVDNEWIKAIRGKRKEEEFLVAWPGFKQNLVNHISSLIAHERLHHGQLITYLTLEGVEIPPKFKRNWAL